MTAENFYYRAESSLLDSEVLKASNLTDTPISLGSKSVAGKSDVFITIKEMVNDGTCSDDLITELTAGNISIVNEKRNSFTVLDLKHLAGKIAPPASGGNETLTETWDLGTGLADSTLDMSNNGGDGLLIQGAGTIDSFLPETPFKIQSSDSFTLMDVDKIGDNRIEINLANFATLKASDNVRLEATGSSGVIELSSSKPSGNAIRLSTAGGDLNFDTSSPGDFKVTSNGEVLIQLGGLSPGRTIHLKVATTVADAHYIDCAPSIGDNTLIRNVKDPVADQDAATKKYIDDAIAAHIAALH